MADMTESEKQLTNLLDGSSKSLFLAYVTANDRLTGMSEAERFADGFRLGAAFAFDTFFSPDGLYNT